MSENKEIIKQWVDAKFEAKIVASLVQRDQYYNPQITVINGKEYQTKLGKANQVQLDLYSVKKLVEALNEIIVKLEEVQPKKGPKDDSETSET